MNKKTGTDIFSATNSLKILSFLVENPGKEFLGSQIQKAASISRAGAYIALRVLIKKNLVIRSQKGKFLIYSVAHNEPAVRQFKVLRNVLLLQPVIEKLKPLSKKVILYGSAGRGEDDSSSDMDLFVLSKDPQATQRILPSIKIRRRIQAVIKSPSELSDLKDRERVFFAEIDRGITLWEEKE